MNAKELLEESKVWAKIPDDNITKKVLIEFAEEYAEYKLSTTKVSDLDIALAAGDDGVDLLRREGFIQGAKWMRDKLNNK